MRKMRAIFGLAVVLLLASTSIPCHAAQEFPTRPIEIVVPYTPGATMDLLARLIGQTAPKFLGQPMVTVTKPGAGGSVAAVDVIGSKPDGHKLMITTNYFFAMTTKTQKVAFDPYTLVPVANFLEYKNGFIVKGSSPWKTFGDAIEFAKKNPGKLRWSHTGRGISQHMYGLLAFRRAGVETTDIPFKGSAEMLSALLGGHTEGSFMVYGAVADHVKTGAVRYLMTVGPHRYSNLPDVPCAPELGFPELAKLPTYVGVYVHRDTPPEVKKTLFDAMKKTFEDPEFRKAFDAIGEEPRFEGPEFVSKAIKDAEEIAVPFLKEFNLYVERK